MLKHLLLYGFLGCMLNCISLPCRGEKPPPYTMQAQIIDGDTILIMELKPYTILAPRVFNSRAEQRRFNRLVYNIKRVYPYAQLAGLRFREYSEKLVHMERDSDRRRAAMKIEEEVRSEFEDELKRLTFSQGLILIKLIDRETSNTSYDLLKDFRGVFSAVFWQGLGRLFGYDLRTEYDPEGEDSHIEEIVQLIEAGLL